MYMYVCVCICMYMHVYVCICIHMLCVYAHLSRNGELSGLYVAQSSTQL